jgi:amidase
MARTVADLDLLFKVIADSTSSGVNDLERSLEDRMAGLRGVRVAWYADDGTTPVTNETRAAVANAAKALNDAGLVVEEGLPPGISRGSALWIELFARAATGQLRESYRGREDEAGPQVSHLLIHFEAGADLQSKIAAAEKVAAAVLERERLREELLRWMKATPLILAPVGAMHAFEHGAQRVAIDLQSISVFRAFGYSQTFNVFGFPGVVVPAGRSLEGMPIGVQVVGGPFEEQIVLAAAAAIEKALGGWQVPLMGATFGSS